MISGITIRYHLLARTEKTKQIDILPILCLAHIGVTTWPATEYEIIIIIVVNVSVGKLNPFRRPNRFVVPENLLSWLSGFRIVWPEESGPDVPKTRTRARATDTRTPDSPRRENRIFRQSPGRLSTNKLDTKKFARLRLARDDVSRRSRGGNTRWENDARASSFRTGTAFCRVSGIISAAKRVGVSLKAQSARVGFLRFNYPAGRRRATYNHNRNNPRDVPTTGKLSARRTFRTGPRLNI